MVSDTKQLVIALVLSALLVSFAIISTTQAASITATVKITVCGDGFVDTAEECDSGALNGASCTTLGFSGGSLSCSVACEFDTSACTVSSPSQGGGGGGGGGGGSIAAIQQPRTASASFSGRAYPGSKVTLLKDAQVAVETVAGPDAKFDIEVSNLSGGSYLFSVYGTDENGNRSTTQSFPINTNPGASASITGIFVTPTISVDKREVKHGDNIIIFGQSVPGAEVTVNINSEKEHVIKRNTDDDGVYLLQFDTSTLEMGSHGAKSKAALAGAITAFGRVVSFTVGTKNVAAQPKTSGAVKGDTNADDRVNLIDFSVVAYWYQRADPPASADLNADGKVDLTDLSIMAFHWTG